MTRCFEISFTKNRGYKKTTNSRGMVFVDPYALHVDWETLKPLASTRVLDVWYLPKSAAVIPVGAGSLAERSSARARECLAAPLDRHDAVGCRWACSSHCCVLPTVSAAFAGRSTAELPASNIASRLTGPSAVMVSRNRLSAEITLTPVGWQ